MRARTHTQNIAMITKKELVMMLAGLPDHAEILVQLPGEPAALPIYGVAQYANSSTPDDIELITTNPATKKKRK